MGSATVELSPDYRAVYRLLPCWYTACAPGKRRSGFEYRWRGLLRRSWMLLPVILLCLVAGTQEVPRRAVSQTPQEPNILLVLTDDQDIGSVS